MKTNALFLAITCAFPLTFSASYAQTIGSPADAQPLPGITIYATGGTIAGGAASNTNTTTYKAGTIGVQTLIDAVPEIKSVARVEGVQIANVPSSDISGEILLRMAKAIKAKLQESSTQGVVITHGTDTLAESAFFLDLTVKTEKPIVFVGAMRPATAISADGPMNLLQAVSLAASKEAVGRGALIALNDRIGSAQYTIKTNSTTLDTFKAEEQGYLGVFYGTQPRFWYGAATPTHKPYFDIDDVTSLPKVVILYSHQDQDVSLIDAAISSGAKGVVIDGSGNGSVNTAVKKKIEELAKQGFPVVRATRTNNGVVVGKPEGISSGIYSASKARWLLTLALAKGASMEQINGYFKL